MAEFIGLEEEGGNLPVQHTNSEAAVSSTIVPDEVYAHDEEDFDAGIAIGLPDVVVDSVDNTDDEDDWIAQALEEAKRASQTTIVVQTPASDLSSEQQEQVEVQPKEAAAEKVGILGRAKNAFDRLATLPSEAAAKAESANPVYDYQVVEPPQDPLLTAPSEAPVWGPPVLRGALEPQEAPMTWIERRRLSKQQEREARVNHEKNAAQARADKLALLNEVEFPRLIDLAKNEIEFKRQLVDPIATPSLTRLPIHGVLNNRTRNLVGLKLGADYGYESDQQQTASLFSAELGSLAAKRRIDFENELDEAKRESVVSAAAAAGQRLLDATAKNILPEVYVNPFPERTTHREFAFSELVELGGLQTAEWDIQERTRRLLLMSRIRVGTNGRYVFDPELDGINKVLGLSDKDFVENVDPAGRDRRISSLVAKALTDGKYPGGLAFEARCAGLLDVEPNPKDENDLNNPTFMGVFEIEPVHVTSESYALLMAEKRKRIGMSGIAKIIKPTRWLLEEAQQTRDGVLPKFTKYAGIMTNARDKSYEAYQEALKNDSEGLQILKEDQAQDMLESGVLPRQFQAPPEIEAGR